MKTIHLFILAFTFVCFTACDSDDEISTGGGFGPEYLWVPNLNESTIADGTVTIRWDQNKVYYTMEATKCYVANFVKPDKFELYQSSQPNDGYTKIAELKYKEAEISYQVQGLQNGKPVYFRVKSVRKGHEAMESGTYQFIPNPKPQSETVFTFDTQQHSQSIISPDGKQIVYVEYQDGDCLYMCNRDGSEKKLINTDSREPFWNLDGSKLYFHKGRYGSAHQLMSHDPKTGEQKVILSGKGYFEYPDVSPDGTKVLYNVNNQGSMDFYVYNIESDRDSLIMRRYLNNEMLEYTEASWISNDQYLVKKSKAVDPYPVSLSLMSYSDQKEEILIEDYSYLQRYAKMSPDKKKIAYISNLNNCSHLFVFDIQSKSYRQITGYESNRYLYFGKFHTWGDAHTLLYSDVSNANYTERINKVSVNF